MTAEGVVGFLVVSLFFGMVAAVIALGLFLAGWKGG